jgi:uncharacterized protein YutE (UPF0331/DUF86 family)
VSISKEFIRTLIRDIEDAMKEIERITSKSYNELSGEEKMTVRYELIVITEAVMALSIHIVRRDLNEKPRTPVNALMILRDRGLLAMNEYEDLARLIRLRNLLVHRYWVIDDYLIYQSIKSNFKNLVSFMNRLRNHYGI